MNTVNQVGFSIVFVLELICEVLLQVKKEKEDEVSPWCAFQEKEKVMFQFPYLKEEAGKHEQHACVFPEGRNVIFFFSNDASHQKLKKSYFRLGNSGEELKLKYKSG